VRLGVQEQRCAGDARCGHRLPAGAGRYPAGHGCDDRDKPYRSASDDEPFAGLAFKMRPIPIVGQLIFFRVTPV
jgi:translation elongation factor EF-G